MQCSDDFLKRVERAYYEHVRPDIGNDGNSHDQAFQDVQLICKRVYDKLPFNDLNDAGKLIAFGDRTLPVLHASCCSLLQVLNCTASFACPYTPP
jgi:hypothetical protein